MPTVTNYRYLDIFAACNTCQHAVAIGLALCFYTPAGGQSLPAGRPKIVLDHMYVHVCMFMCFTIPHYWLYTMLY